MGIHSDTLEAIKERGFDPYSPGGYILNERWGENVKRVYNTADRLHTASTEHSLIKSKEFEREIRKKQDFKSIQSDLNYLENERLKYVVIEKVALWILNKENLKCPLVTDIIRTICEQSCETYRYIIELKEEISEEILKSVNCEIRPIDENNIKQYLLTTIVCSIEFAFRRGLRIGRKIFIKLVKDIGILMEELLLSNGNRLIADKKIVEQYFQKQCKLEKGMVKCPNCGELLFDNFPYCFNCFDGED